MSLLFLLFGGLWLPSLACLRLASNALLLCIGRLATKNSLIARCEILRFRETDAHDAHDGASMFGRPDPESPGLVQDGMKLL